MEKLTLSNPITINGKKVKTLTYDTGAITVGMFAEAEALKLRATTHKAGGSAGGMLSVYYITRNTLYLTCKGKSAAYKKLKTVIPILTGAARYALTKALGRKKGRSYGAYRGAVDFWQGKMGRMEG